jgi:phosphoglycerate dehydrogenase-like enzyme
MLPGDKRREILWNADARETARRLGFKCHLTPAPRTVCPTQWPELIGDVDALLTSWGAVQLTDDVLPSSMRLKVVAHAAGSVEPIVSTAIFDRGIRLLSANRYMASSVAQWSLMMTLAGLRRLTEVSQIGLHGRFHRGMNFRAMDQTTVGIWGFGDIARELIKLLKSLGTKNIIIYSDFLLPEQADALGVQKVDFDALFEQSDVLHLCESLREDTFERVTQKQLSKMKSQAILINAGRAHLVRERDLLDALQAGHVFAVLDVHYQEPLPAGSPFRQLDNVILTPHIAGLAGQDRYVSIMLEQIDCVLNNQCSDYEITAQRAARMTASMVHV